MIVSIILTDMTSKNIIANLNKDDNLNGVNYNTWLYKIWYVLEEQNCLEGINHMMEDQKWVRLFNKEGIKKLTIHESRKISLLVEFWQILLWVILFASVCTFGYS